jgi:hypothetical protein
LRRDVSVFNLQAGRQAEPQLLALFCRQHCVATLNQT